MNPVTIRAVKATSQDAEPINVTIGRFNPPKNHSTEIKIPLVEGQSRTSTEINNASVVLMLWNGDDSKPNVISQCIIGEHKFKEAIALLFGSMPISNEQQLKELFK